MSKKDLQRIEVLTEVLAGRRTTESAAGVLNVSLRQAQRLLARYEDGGGAALIHKARGRPATNTFNVGVRDYVLELVRQNYRDFGPTLASEALLERHGVEVSRDAAQVDDGSWLVAVTQAASDLSSTAAAAGELRRAGADRRQPAPLVRATWRGLHVAGFHRRCDQQADAAALRSK
jgi:transposase